MLRGHAMAKVDDKGRLKIPAEFQQAFLEQCGDSRRTFVTSLDGKRVRIYPLTVWLDHETKMAQLPKTDPDLAHYSTVVNFWGKETPIDNHGRLLIHPMLRAKAGIQKDVSVFGKQNYLELCDFELYRHDPPTVGPEGLVRLAEKYGL